MYSDTKTRSIRGCAGYVMISYFPISRSVGVGLMLSEGSNPDRALITKYTHTQQVGGSKPSIAARMAAM